ncbi:DUF1801 domain-containing protein [Phytomonospora endophytica]|uniref:YdhG-like domain-containing protein n=1 Tax=Phytomonospora endophytica TaxID=714109 RepID=A0A841FA59_9ACTN|nr:DUF1801 domain-containing protein [Phytomonospora endophytica]MBB6032634.1 hypothetical protein [Phytomonospora endophytica]GIG66216.1 hypothetical protein Pen01_25110 [Phytomonospora endophytica]
MRSEAEDVEEYIAALPEGRREAITAVRELILANLPEGYREEMAFGMIGYVVPLERYPVTYNKQPLSFAALASQKNHMSLYLMTVYGEAGDAFRERWAATGKKLDMGKSCVRFRSVDDLAFDVIAAEIAANPVDLHIEHYEASRRG